MPITDAEIIDEMTGCGVRLDECVLIGDLIFFVAINDYLENRLTFDDAPGEPEGAFREALVAYLRRRGARQYASEAEFKREAGGGLER
jgi:hypothetical protein